MITLLSAVTPKALQSLERNALPFDKFISLDDKDALLRALKKTYAAFDAVGRESLVRTIAKKLNVRADRLFAELKHGKHSTRLSGEEPDQPKAQMRQIFLTGFVQNVTGFTSTKRIRMGRLSRLKSVLLWKYWL